MDLSAALERLGRQLDQLGVPRWQPPQDTGILDEIAGEIAPMRIPAEVMEFWRQVDVTTLRVYPYPEFSTPEFNLQSWRMSRDEFRNLQPLAVFQVGYQSHAVMSVELDTDHVEGGALFDWFVSDPSGFDRVHESLAGWIEYISGLLERVPYVRWDRDDGPWLLVPDPDHWQAARDLLPPLAPHPVHGSETHIDGDILNWPEHWQRANGLTPDMLRPRGATHTIAQLLETPPDAKVTATIAGHVMGLGGSSAGTQVLVDDGTAQISVFCPPYATLLGPALRGRYEFDVTVPPGERLRPVDPETAAAGLTDRAARIAAMLQARAGGIPSATATAVRRVD